MFHAPREVERDPTLHPRALRSAVPSLRLSSRIRTRKPERESTPGTSTRRQSEKGRETKGEERRAAISSLSPVYLMMSRGAVHVKRRT